MEEYCRLCAVLRFPEEIKCTIYDKTFDIERKLASCCNWNSFRTHQQLPENVCIPCFLQLEQCWYFRETVSRAQQKLYDLMGIDVELELSENSMRNPVEVQVKVENVEEEIEVGPVIVSDLKVENDFDGYDNDYVDANYDSEYEIDKLNESKVDVDESFDKTSTKVQKAKISSTKSKTEKNKVKHNNQVKKLNTGKKMTTIRSIEFDIKSLLSREDVNEDKTIKPEKMQELGLCNWEGITNRCYFCKIDFNTHSKLLDHFTNTHSNDKIKYTCPICPNEILFLSARYYREHIAKTHYPHLTYCCHRCQKFFHDQKKIREHIKSHPKEKQFSVCTTCGKRFSYYKNLHFHMLTHLPIELQRRFECYLCKKSLKSHQSLQKHMKYHIGISRTKICDQCGKAFPTTYKLKKHMTTHSDVRPYSCDICQKTFKTTSILRRHARIHQEYKAYVCDICGHRTLDKGALKLHIVRYHTDESPFPCDICGRKFYSRRTMKTHQKNMHFAKKPFPCNICDHRAVNQNALRRHHNHVHLDHRPHACSLCDYRTYSKHNLRLHISRRHRELYEMHQTDV